MTDEEMPQNIVQPGGSANPEGHLEEAGELGALSVQAQYEENDNDLTHPRGNPDLAQEMSHEVEPLIQVVENVRNSNLPDKEERAKEIEAHGEELMEQARERYVAEEKRYTTLRDHVLGALLDTLQRRGNGSVWLFEATEQLGNGSLPGVAIDTGSQELGVSRLSKEQVSRLRKEFVALLGGNPDDDPLAEETPANPKELDGVATAKDAPIESNIPGVKAWEALKFSKDHGLIMKERRFWIERQVT